MKVAIEDGKEQPFAARIIIKGWPTIEIDEARKMLDTVCKKWPPENKKVKFLITPGGFITFEWPKNLPEKIDKRNPDPEIIRVLEKKAEKTCRELMLSDLRKKLCNFTKYLTLGIDSERKDGRYQIQMVAFLDLDNNKYYWTGKSHPVKNEEKNLIKMPLKTHFFKKIMILGCHDLYLFGNRSRDNKAPTPKNILKKEFIKMANDKKPIFVLQHPHTAVKINSWRNAWSGLMEKVPTVRRYAGSGRYHGDTTKRSEWDSLSYVLNKTKRGNTIDFIFKKDRFIEIVES